LAAALRGHEEVEEGAISIEARKVYKNRVGQSISKLIKELVETKMLTRLVILFIM
jgi:hypothetical protein